jgi:hypothetical protein
MAMFNSKLLVYQRVILPHMEISNQITQFTILAWLSQYHWVATRTLKQLLSVP